MAVLLLAWTTSPARADCAPAPIADPDDMVVSFLAASGVQVASGSRHASTVKEGMLVYDDTSDTLKLCDGSNWIEVGSGSGMDTLASLSCSAGEIAKFNGSAWACAADDGGGGSEISFTAKASSESLTFGWTDNIGFGNEVTDVGGDNYNPTTGKFTAPEGGVYVFSATIVPSSNVSINGRLGVVIQKAATGSVSSGYVCGNLLQTSSTTTVWPSCTGAISLAANDQVEVLAYAEASTPTLGGGTNFSGYKISAGGGSDTLSGLSCATNDIPKWNGTAWACAIDGGGSGGGNGMQAGWPDAILCSGGTGTTTFLQAYSATAADAMTYGLAWTYDDGLINEPQLQFSSPTATASLSGLVGWTGYTESCAGKTIAQLEAAGQTVVFSGGGAVASSNAADIAFNAQGTASVSSTVVRNFATVDPNSGNAYDNSTGMFTAPEDGYYFFSGTVLTQSGTGATLSLQKNGSSLSRGYVNDADYNTATATAVALLDAGDQITLNLGAGTIHTNAWHSFNGFKIGGADTLAGLSCAANEIPKWNGSAWACAADGGGNFASATYVSAVDSANQTLTPTASKLTNWAEQNDVGNNFASGTFTATAGGYYAVSGGIGTENHAVNEYVEAQIRVNGANLSNSRDSSTAAWNDPFTSTTWYGYLDNGDTVELWGRTYSTPATTYDTRLQIVSVGGGSDTLSGLSCSTNQIPKWSGTAWACAPDGNDDDASMTGAVMAFNASSCPTGWTEFTVGRGRFLRGIDNGAGVDPDGTRTAGSLQDDALQNITGTIGNVLNESNSAIPSSGALEMPTQGNVASAGSGSSARYGDVSFDASRVARTSTETRPKNVAVIFCLYNGTSGLGSSSASEAAFSVHKNGTNQTGLTDAGWNKLTWSTEDFDIGDNFASDRFVAPVAGRYQFNATARCSIGTSCGVALHKNGSQVINSYAPTTDVGNTVSAVISLAAGEYVEAFVRPAGTTTVYGVPSTTRFSGFLITGGWSSGSATAAGDGGQIQFNDGSGAFAADAALHWDNTNKRLGIGTATPGSLLDVEGSARIGGLLTVGTDTSGQVTVRGGSGTSSQVRFYDAGAEQARVGVPTGKAYLSLSGSATLDSGHLVVTDIGNVGIGTDTPAPSSLLDLTSATKGFLPPRMTTMQRNAISSPATGLMIFDTTIGQLQYYAGTAWIGVDSGLPAGTISAFAATTCPDGWSEYVAARGRFLRGIDNGAGNDPAGTRAPGNVQMDEFRTHTHTDRDRYGTYSGGRDNTKPDGYLGSGLVNADTVTGAAGGAETRPKNVAVLFCQYDGGAPLTATPSGAAGAIQFADGAGGLDSEANIVVSGGNVGVGTAAPWSRLHVWTASSENVTGLYVDGGGDSANEYVAHFSGRASAFPSTVLRLSSNRISSSGFNFLEAIQDEDGTPNTAFVVRGDGNVGIGTTATGEKLHVMGGIRSEDPSLTGNVIRMTADTTNGPSIWGQTDSTGNATYNVSSARLQLGNGGFQVATSPATPAGSARTFTTRMVVESTNGNVGIGITNPDVKLTVQDSQAAGFVARFMNAANVPGASGIIIEASSASSAGGAALIQFLRSGGAAIGSVTHNGLGTVSYNTTSDARLKEHIVPTGIGLSTLMNIQVRDYNYLGQPDRKEQGFIAQELYAAYPQVVKVGGADAKKDPWSIEYGKLTPLLVKAVQELKADNDNLRAQLKTANDDQATEIEELRQEIKALKAAR